MFLGLFTSSFTRACQKLVEHQLEEGAKRHDDFVGRCIESPEKFEAANSRSELETFTKKQGARNKQAQDPVLRELRCTRDSFARIAVIAAQKKVDLAYLLTFPLTPVPLNSLCKIDGTPNHTD